MYDKSVFTHAGAVRIPIFSSNRAKPWASYHSVIIHITSPMFTLLTASRQPYVPVLPPPSIFEEVEVKPEKLTPLKKWHFEFFGGKQKTLRTNRRAFGRNRKEGGWPGSHTAGAPLEPRRHLRAHKTGQGKPQSHSQAAYRYTFRPLTHPPTPPVKSSKTPPPLCPGCKLPLY